MPIPNLNQPAQTHAPSDSPQKAPKKRRKLRKSALIVIILIIAVLCALAYYGYKKLNPLSMNSTTYIAQYMEPFDAKANLKGVFLDSNDKVSFEGSVDTSEISTSECAYIYKGRRYPFTVQVRDTKGPELEVQDVKVDTNHNVTPQDFLVSCSDPSNYTLRIDGDDPNGAPGNYTISVTARDDFDNTTTKKARLERYEDTKAPDIEDFSEKLTMKQGYDYPSGSLVVKDDHDENPVLEVDTSMLNTSEPGDYPVILTTRDISGNEQSYTQTVTVEADPDFGKKICYLTFDDGPSATTEDILRILRDMNAQATFFVTGTNPEYNSLMKEIVDNGHSIALHTYSHDYDSIYASEEAYFDDLQKISDLVKSETGVETKVIRFPGGSSNLVSSANEGIMTRLVDEVQKKGYAYFDWNADSTDATGNDIDPSQLVESATASIGEDKVVLLMHDSPTKSTTADALPAIIQAYRDAGYEFRGLTTDTPPVHHNVNN